MPGGALPGASRCAALHADPSAGVLSPAIEAMDIRTSPLQHVPGVFRHYRHLLPLMPLAAAISGGLGDVDLVISLSHCVAKAVRAAAGRPARLLLLHADAIRLASARDLPRRLVAIARCVGPLARTLLDRLRRLGPSDRATGHALRGDLGDGPRADRPLLRPRQPGDPAAGRHRRSTPPTRTDARATTAISSSRRWCRTSGSTRRSPACTRLGASADRHRRGPRTSAGWRRWPARRSGSWAGSPTT